MALGQPAAGDDGLGQAVLARLRAGGVPPGVELCAAAEASALVDLACFPGPVAIVDALLAPPGVAPGRVIALPPEALATAALTPLSSHGLSAAGAVALARELSPAALSPRITFVGVTITAPSRYVEGLTPVVAAAVEDAARAALLAVLPGA